MPKPSTPLTYADLRAAQFREFPDSLLIPTSAMLKWAESATTDAARLMRYRALAYTLPFSPVLFYRTHESGSLGARYGTEPHEYMSGFDFL